jgi:hypothetical protein
MGQLLALDFDGVVNSYTSGWIKDDPLLLPDRAVAGAFDFIKLAQQHFEVHIHSSRLRYNGGEDAIKAWFFRELSNEGWGPVSAAAMVGQLHFSALKPPAHLTLDDRSIQFNGIFPKLDEIIDFKPWNKRNTLIPPKVPGLNTWWKHSSGRLYQVYDVTNLYSDRPEKFPVSISYRGENGKTWSRKLSDWHRSFVASNGPAPKLT